MPVLKITLAPCGDHEKPIGAIYLMDDSPLYRVCEFLAKEALTVVSIDPIDSPSDEELTDALSGSLRLHDA